MRQLFLNSDEMALSPQPHARGAEGAGAGGPHPGRHSLTSRQVEMCPHVDAGEWTAGPLSEEDPPLPGPEEPFPWQTQDRKSPSRCSFAAGQPRRRGAGGGGSVVLEAVAATQTC